MPGLFDYLFICACLTIGHPFSYSSETQVGLFHRFCYTTNLNSIDSPRFSCYFENHKIYIPRKKQLYFFDSPQFVVWILQCVNLSDCDICMQHEFTYERCVFVRERERRERERERERERRVQICVCEKMLVGKEVRYLWETSLSKISCQILTCCLHF